MPLSKKKNHVEHKGLTKTKYLDKYAIYSSKSGENSKKTGRMPVYDYNYYKESISWNVNKALVLGCLLVHVFFHH